MSHPIDEVWDDYIETLRCAAVERKCDACDEPIPLGHCYYDIECVIREGDNDEEDNEREVEKLTRCLRCQKIHEHLRKLAPGEMWPDEQLSCGEEYEEHWGKPPPAEIAELAFVSSAEMQTPELQTFALRNGPEEP